MGGISRIDGKMEAKAAIAKTYAEPQKVLISGNSGNALQSSSKEHARSVSNNKIATIQRDPEKEQNVSVVLENEIEKIPIKDEKLTKDERSIDDGAHHMHREKVEQIRERESKLITRVDVERERTADRASSVTSTGSNSSHSQRRSVDPSEPEKEIKRRKLEQTPTSTGKSPHHEERSREKAKESDHSSGSNPERKIREKGEKSRDGKAKLREKADRKRDRADDKEVVTPGETKKRKDDDAGKTSGRQNGENETRERDRHKREETEERKSRSRELREEKKHHRTVSGTNSASSKKR